MRNAAVVLLLAVCLACDRSDKQVIEPCTERTKIVEIIWGEMFESALTKQLNDLLAGGWTCVGEPVRNAFGVRIGTKHSCTICD